MTCPHCGDEGLERGATGIDLCTECGRLSRDGHPLPSRRSFQTFGRPQMVDLKYVHAHGAIVAAVVLGDGSTGIAMTFALADGELLTPIVLSGEEARHFTQTVVDAHAAAQRTRN